jgi:hypothetical protein
MKPYYMPLYRCCVCPRIIGEYYSRFGSGGTCSQWCQAKTQRLK